MNFVFNIFVCIVVFCVLILLVFIVKIIVVEVSLSGHNSTNLICFNILKICTHFIETIKIVAIISRKNIVY